MSDYESLWTQCVADDFQASCLTPLTKSVLSFFEQPSPTHPVAQSYQRIGEVWMSDGRMMPADNMEWRFVLALLKVYRFVLGQQQADARLPAIFDALDLTEAEQKWVRGDGKMPWADVGAYRDNTEYPIVATLVSWTQRVTSLLEDVDDMLEDAKTLPLVSIGSAGQVGVHFARLLVMTHEASAHDAPVLGSVLTEALLPAAGLTEEEARAIVKFLQHDSPSASVSPPAFVTDVTDVRDAMDAASLRDFAIDVLSLLPQDTPMQALFMLLAQTRLSPSAMRGDPQRGLTKRAELLRSWAGCPYLIASLIKNDVPALTAEDTSRHLSSYVEDASLVHLAQDVAQHDYPPNILRLAKRTRLRSPLEMAAWVSAARRGHQTRADLSQERLDKALRAFLASGVLPVDILQLTPAQQRSLKRILADSGAQNLVVRGYQTWLKNAEAEDGRSHVGCLAS